MSGEGHRDRMEQNLTATSPSGLQRLCGKGMTGTAQGSDTGEIELRTEVHAIMCELQVEKNESNYTSEQMVSFSGQCLAVMALVKMTHLVPMNLHMAEVVSECVSKKELGS